MTKLRRTKGRQLFQCHTAGKYTARTWTKWSDSRTHTLFCAQYYLTILTSTCQPEKGRSYKTHKAHGDLVTHSRSWRDGEKSIPAAFTCITSVTDNIWWLGLCLGQRSGREYSENSVSLESVWMHSNEFGVLSCRDVSHPFSTLAVSPASFLSFLFPL